MTIVPEEAAIEIEAMILNKDIGFVETDQKATVKVDAFPFTRYGTVEGTVKTVSRDAVNLRDAADPVATVSQSAAQQGRAQHYVFPATITLATDKIAAGDKLLPLSPGMSVTVEIKTGQRRIIDFLLSPLRENAAGVGHER
jgi:hemolysin D